MAHRIQECACRGLANASVLRDIVHPAAIDFATVEITATRNAGLDGSASKVVEGRHAQSRPFDAQLAGIAAHLVATAGVALETPVDGQDFIPSPARESRLAPALEIRCGPTDVDATIDRRGAAQDLASRYRHRPSQDR